MSDFGNWKDIEGYPKYKVSDRGFVMNKKTMRMIRSCCDSAGYPCLNLYHEKIRKHCRVHNLVANTVLENPNKYNCVDHIDHDKTNNCVTNLRWCSSSQNSMNRSKQANATSNYKGVSWHKQSQKWCAQISVDCKRKHIGLFESEVQAAVAYNNAAICHYAEFACLNVIPLDSITVEN